MFGLSSNAIKYAVKASGPFAKTIAQAQKPAKGNLKTATIENTRPGGQRPKPTKPAKAYLPKHTPVNPAKVAGIIGSLVGGAYTPAKQGHKKK